MCGCMWQTVSSVHAHVSASVARRFDYSQDFLKWALQPPGARPDWVLGMRMAASKQTTGT